MVVANKRTGFYIKEVTAVSAEKGNASVTFGPGLNIIQGHSNTGKTYVAKCIDYIFGAEDSPFDVEETGYTGIIMSVVANNGGEITFERKIGEGTVNVQSSVPGIQSDIYVIGNTRTKENLPMNIIWLNLMGITDAGPDKPTVAANNEFKPQRLTWRTLIRLFYLDEERIDGRAPIVHSSGGNYANSPFLSSLLFLLYDKSFSKEDAIVSRKIKKASRIAVSDYVRKSMEQAENRRKG